MRTDDAIEILNALRSGALKVSDLKGEEFQKIIFHRLLERCRRSEDFEYDIVDNYHEAVDFVVREKPLKTSPFHTECLIHVFECKHYRRTLELSTVAKLLVFGVRFQPASLNVVSSTSLQPQVYDYARVLFNGLGNEAAMFRSTFFRHYRTNDLLDINVNSEDDEKESTEGEPKSKPDLDISWEVTECQPFLERIIADSQNRSGELALNGRWSYRLKLLIYTQYNPEELRIWLDDLPGGIVAHVRHPEVTLSNSNQYHLRIVHTLDLRNLKEEARGHITLHISYKTRSHHALTVPFCATTSAGNALPINLRKQGSDAFANQLQERNAPRILFLGGPAGVGKTYFCESIAERARIVADFDVNRFSIDSNAGTDLIRTMMITICTPASARTNSSDEWQKLASNLLNALSPIDNIAHRQIEHEEVDVIVPVLAEFIVRAGPRLLVLRDAHLITEYTARALSALVSRLDDLGWGEVYCIVEHRTPSSANNIHWNDFEARTQDRINAFLSRNLEPLSMKELDDYLTSVFAHITPELKGAIWERCGGIPLYLSSFIDLLKSHKAIEEADDGSRKWRIRRPSAFAVSAYPNQKGYGILRERITSIAWGGTLLPEEFREHPLSLVAILAIAREEIRVQKLCQLVEISVESLRSVRRTLMLNNIVRHDGQFWSFEFQHDLLRLAAIEVGRAATFLQPFAERLLSKIWSKSSSAIELELGGDIAGWMGMRDDSNRALNAAFERIADTDNSIAIYRVLAKLCSGLEPIAFNSQENYTAYLSCRFSLARAAWNNGSLIEAREQYDRLALDVVSNYGLIDSIAAEASAADARRRVLGIDLDLQDISGFMESAQRALALSGTSVVFHSILNRLILYCAEFSHIEFGLALADLTLKIFGDPKPESAGAVICTDIGRLFRSAMPGEALNLYRQGVKLAYSFRQKLYNEMDVLTMEVLLGQRQLTIEEIRRWRNTLSDNGLKGMLLRFDLFCASVALRDGQVDRARRMFRHLETAVAVYRYENCWLPLWNDQLIGALLESDYDEVEILADKILHRVEWLIQQRYRAIEKLLGLKSAIATHEPRFSHLEPLDVKIPPVAPSYSGILIQILLNLGALSNIVGESTRDKLRKVPRLWPGDIDYEKALAAFSAQPAGSTITCRGQSLILCSQ